KIAGASDDLAKAQARKERQNTIKRLEKKALEKLRSEQLKKKQDERLAGVKSDPNANAEPNLLNELIPERGRIASKMLSDRPIEIQDKAESIRDMQALLTCSTIYHRPGEVPQGGACPYCRTGLEE